MPRLNKTPPTSYFSAVFLFFSPLFFLRASCSRKIFYIFRRRLPIFFLIQSLPLTVFDGRVAIYDLGRPASNLKRFPRFTSRLRPKNSRRRRSATRPDAL